MKNKLFIATFMLVAVFGGVVATTPTAEASCSYNGYMNSNGKCGVSYKYKQEYRYANANVYSVEYLRQYIAQLQVLLAQLQAAQGGTNNGGYGNSDVDVATKSADDISDDAATLRGELDFNDEDEATVYFRYGTSINNLSRETTNVVLEEDEDDETFSARITGLDEDKTYYFRAIAEDENGDRDYGTILSFRTDDDSSNDDDDDDNSNDDEDMPEVDNLDANDISDDSAELEGSLDMNDFENGFAFFVYGEDEDQVDDIANDYDSYSDVDEDGDNLQKIAVDSDADGDNTYWATMNGLNEDTEIFYTLCVAFEDEDGDEVIVCGDTESFTTDEN